MPAKATNAAWVFGYVGTFIGLLTLAAASAAAWYARKAAIHTEESAVEARRAADAAEETLSLANKTSEIELRAYIRSLEDTVTRDKKNPGMLNVTLHYKNAGETPAHNVEMTVDTSFETLESEIGLRTKAFGKSASIGSQKCFNWGTEGKEADFLCYFDVNLSEEQIAKIEDGTGVLVLKSIMFFQDEFGVKWANAHDYYINGHALENNAVYTRFSETQRVEEKSKPKRRSSKRA